jgi:VWFA-related protein
MRSLLVAVLLTSPLVVRAADDPVVFKSDVAMTRVDAQVVDSDGRIITGLRKEDFVLRLDGKVTPIRNFASENVPIDILLLLDVSGSMQPHVERIDYAARQALNVLAAHDRIGVMVFDTRTRLKLPFTSNHSDVTSALDRLLRSETFHGGTQITNSLISAADYMQREARPDARRAIVILTDDETQDSEDEPRVERSLARANAMLSFLQAPYEVPNAGYPGGHRRGGTWGGSGGGGIGLPGGGVGFPGGGGIGLPGRGGPMGGNDPSHSAGTAQIATDTGGDTMNVEDARALEDTLTRLRQRYALYFYLPEGSKSGSEQRIQVDLAQQARIQYAQADVRYRHASISGSGVQNASGPTLVTHAPAATSTDDEPTLPSTSSPSGRRVMVNEDSGSHVNLSTDANDSGSTPSAQTPSSGWPRTTGTKPPQ